MAIVSISEVERATGTCYDPSESKRIEYYIDYISALVEDFTGKSFTQQTDVVLTAQSDAYGYITLGCTPIQEVASVEYSTIAVPVVGVGSVIGWMFDGIDTLFCLPANLAVNITATFGYAVAPMPVKGYVIEAVKYVIDNPQGLSSFRVGDVTQTYIGAGGTAQFQQISNDALEAYMTTEATMRLGKTAYQQSNLPTL